MGTSNNHKILSEIGALYCRENWNCWCVAIEPQGLTNRNYDVLAIQSSPRSIIAMEVKVDRQDFLAGIKKGHFEQSQYITELWLVYTGQFEIKELPAHVGILKAKRNPVCKVHHDLKTVCDHTCKRRRNIFLTEVRPAKYWHSKDDRNLCFSTYVPKWLWKISTSLTTRTLHGIEYNLIGDIENEKSNGNFEVE